MMNRSSKNMKSVSMCNILLRAINDPYSGAANYAIKVASISINLNDVMRSWRHRGRFFIHSQTDRH